MLPKASLTQHYFFFSKYNKNKYAVKNTLTLLYFSLYNEIYFINRTIYFLFVYYSIMKWKIKYSLSIFILYLFLFYFKRKNKILHWRFWEQRWCHDECWKKGTKQLKITMMKYEFFIQSQTNASDEFWKHCRMRETRHIHLLLCIYSTMWMSLFMSLTIKTHDLFLLL